MLETPQRLIKLQTSTGFSVDSFARQYVFCLVSLNVELWAACGNDTISKTCFSSEQYLPYHTARSPSSKFSLGSSIIVRLLSWPMVPSDPSSSSHPSPMDSSDASNHFSISAVVLTSTFHSVVTSPLVSPYWIVCSKTSDVH
jgi:hypothetical protein